MLRLKWPAGGGIFAEILYLPARSGLLVYLVWKIIEEKALDV